MRCNLSQNINFTNESSPFQFFLFRFGFTFKLLFALLRFVSCLQTLRTEFYYGNYTESIFQFQTFAPHWFIEQQYLTNCTWCIYRFKIIDHTVSIRNSKDFQFKDISNISNWFHWWNDDFRESQEEKCPFFKKFRNLFTLSWGNAHFCRCCNLSRSVLYGNKIKNLPTNVFRGLTSLQLLLLNANEISCIRKDTFKDLNSLSLLSLYDNNIQSLANGTFDAMKSIQTL